MTGTMTGALARSVELLQARITIEDLMTLYAERVDAGDMEGVGQLFAKGCVAMPGGTELVGSEAVRDGYVAAVKFYDADGQRADYERLQTTPRTRHFVTNKMIEFNGAVTAADCRSAFFVMQQIGERSEPIVGGRYLDRFEKDLSGWHFVRREVVIDHVGDTSHHNAQPGG